MEIITFDNDIEVFYIAAQSFPDGVMAAHMALHALVPLSKERKYFGLSRPENGAIAYKAAVEEINPGEAERLHCDSLILNKGKYASLTIPDFMNHLPLIGESFQQLLSRHDLDPEGYCVEWYFNETDVRCMIRLNE